jgi:protein-tyrosine phosphatase
MIFNLFKSKPTLKELIPKGFVDIHSHILPGIDDGAKNIEESLTLISEMKNMGFSKIIATPHTYTGLYDNTKKTILDSYNLIKNKIEDIELSYATEYMIDIDLIKKAENTELICLKKKYVLVEMSCTFEPNNLNEIIYKLIINDYTPIIAHPERYIYFFNNSKIYKNLKKIGCKFQMNLLSISGFYGNKILKFSEKLLNENIIDYYGSDIHNHQQLRFFDKKIKINDYAKIQEILKKNINDFS